ncbi:MAG: Uma2 family endonuclease [Enhygromyxa sp.]
MSATSPSPVERPHTYGDIRAWDDDTRWELIDGEAHAMAGPSWYHQSVVMALSAQLFAHFRERGCQVLPAPLDVRLPRGDEADDEVQTVVQPDIVVVCDLDKLDQRGCRGAPDLVIEVLSPSTAGRDQITKRALYERHGVQQYWLVHPTDRVVTIHRRAQAGFAPPDLFEARGVVPVAGYEGLEIDWDQAFASVPRPD